MVYSSTCHSGGPAYLNLPQRNLPLVQTKISFYRVFITFKALTIKLALNGHKQMVVSIWLKIPHFHQCTCTNSNAVAMLQLHYYNVVTAMQLVAM